MAIADDRLPVATLPRLTLPEIPRATPEEIERRRQLFAETMALRDEIGSIGISTEDLIRELRADPDDS